MHGCSAPMTSARSAAPARLCLLASFGLALLWTAPALHGQAGSHTGSKTGSQTGSQTKSPVRPSIQVPEYRIDLTLDPPHHSLSAKTTVTFTPQKTAQTVSFALNPALRIGDAQDARGDSLRVTRVTPGGDTVRVTAPAPLEAGAPAAWTFAYSGVLSPHAKGRANQPTAPVPLASVGDPISYLLRKAHWFPAIAGGGRFTADIRVHVPEGEIALGSGPSGPPHAAPNGATTFRFRWTRPGLPGTIVVGKFRESDVPGTSSKVRLYWVDSTANDKSVAAPFDVAGYAKSASEVYRYLVSQFGPPPSGRLDIVELPDGTVPAASSPGIAAIAAKQMASGNAFRLLANTVARQWWGGAVQPQTRNDAWITHGMCRYAELGFLKQHSGRAALANALLNVSASALAVPTPLQNASRFPPGSPEFQSLTYDKGAMVLRMLDWRIGGAAFRKTLQSVLAAQDGSVSTAGLERLAERASGQDLASFFTQWVDETGAPALQDNWVLYRLSGHRGYRIVGEIHEDLDLFRTPVDIQVKTQDKTVHRRVEVAGPRTQFTVDTLSLPKKISLDPDRRLLRNGPAVEVRMHVLRGQRKAADQDFTAAVSEYRKALAIDPISSLANFHLGQAYVHLGKSQAAEGAFRAALDGDGTPKWTKAWSELELGKIFDAAGQRQRAVNQYRKVLEANGASGAAKNLARGYLQTAYRPEKPPAKPR